MEGEVHTQDNFHSLRVAYHEFANIQNKSND
jgi:hypothetical protein